MEITTRGTPAYDFKRTLELVKCRWVVGGSNFEPVVADANADVCGVRRRRGRRRPVQGRSHFAKDVAGRPALDVRFFHVTQEGHSACYLGK
jgi:hypothetical protein